MAKSTKAPKHSVGIVGEFPDFTEPWPEAFCGNEIPSIKVPYPPKLYSAECKSKDYYKTEHGEYFLGFWADGRITLCQHDQKCDFCRTAEGKVYLPGGKYGGPTWIMPLEFAEAPIKDKEA